MLQQTWYRSVRSDCGGRWTIKACAIVCLVLYSAPVAAQDSVIVLQHNKDVTSFAYRNDRDRRARTAERLADQSRHMGRMYFLIPEYHDEQQFQIGPNDFGPMVYIYASPFIGAFTRLSDIVEQGTYGTFAADRKSVV